jgi:hypothetical protein
MGRPRVAALVVLFAASGRPQSAAVAGSVVEHVTVRDVRGALDFPEWQVV